MTPSDRDPNTPDPANPFDTGLPMLRMPPPAKGKRKRRRQAGRVIGRYAEAARSEAARPEPAVTDSTGTAGEPIPPLPVPEGARPSGDWAQWLEPRTAATSTRTRTGVPADDPPGDRSFGGQGSGEQSLDQQGFGEESFDQQGSGEEGFDQQGFGEDDYADYADDDFDDRHAADTDSTDRESADPAAPDRRFDRRYRATSAFDDPGPDEPKRLPSLIDRTGGSPGPSLRRPRPHGGDSGSGNDRMIAVLVVVGVLIAVGSIVWAVLPGSPPEQQAEQVPVEQAAVPVPTTTAPEVAAVATPGCEQRNSAEVVSGTHPGGTTDGPSAILAFEHAYYVLRSGAAARAVVTPDSPVPAADQIQRGIDQVPVGTRYCVQITKVQVSSSDGTTHWEVRLTQQYPDEQPKTFLQSIATRTHTGRTLIESISMA